MRNRKQIILAYLAVFAAGVVLALPVLLNGFRTATFDGPIHSLWSFQFSQQFWGGEWYPRWLTELNGGLGSPIFFYYPPLPYLVTASLHPLISNDPQGWRALGMSAGLGLMLSGLFAFAWLRWLVPLWPAAGAAIIYMAMPFHLLVNLHTRGAFAEFWGMTWLPLVLWSVCRIGSGRRHCIIGLAFAYASLITSHLPTTLVFSLVPPVYAILVASSDQRQVAFIKTVGGMALGIGLAAVFLGPALTLQAAVSMDELTRFSYEGSFFLSDKTDEFKTNLFWIVVSTLGVGGCSAALALQNAEDESRWHVVFWCQVAGICTLMMTPLSKPVWELVRTLQIIQFPWRFNTVLSVAIAALLALGLAAIKGNFSWQIITFGDIALAIIISWLGFTIIGVWPCFTQKIPIETDPLLCDVPEYRPRWVRAGLESTLAKFKPENGSSAKVAFAQGGGSIVVESWKPRRIELMIMATNMSMVLVHQYYYAGWCALVDKQPYSVGILDPDGLVELSLTKGVHHVELRLERTKQERLSLMITWFSLLVAVAMLASPRRVKTLAQTKVRHLSHLWKAR